MMSNKSNVTSVDPSKYIEPIPSKMRRVGVTLPSTDVTIEKEFYKYLPDSISLHFTRMPLDSVTEEGLEKMSESALDCARLIADMKPDLVVYACTSGTFIKGKAFDEKMKEKIELVTGVPVISMASAVIELLKETNMTKVATYAPYPPSICEKLRDYIQSFDIGICGNYSLGITDDNVSGNLTSENIARFVMDYNTTDSDGIFISCSNLEIIDQLNMLKRVLHKPVFSSNLAVIASILKYFDYPLQYEIFQCCLHENHPLIKKDSNYSRTN
ncbi:hypothetical protein [Moorena sp. SIO4G3]|uniref:maleate cis-trans isomerase family protein n=1 Tax=Moorena sp. SIO4G3 TaxID=2607821 RepID=UPI00142CB337|nr:hypothetical protein [Moorena sp. SIO4G3]NEO78804.1 hypothetical protein [Moorena sp. SIO4G3]